MTDKSKTVTARPDIRESLPFELERPVFVEKNRPGYIQKYVIYTYKHDPNRVARYRENSWEIVYSDVPAVTNVLNHADKSESDKRMRPGPVIVKLNGGHMAVLMEIEEKTYNQNQKQRDENEKARYKKAHKVSFDPNTLLSDK